MELVIVHVRDMTRMEECKRAELDSGKYHLTAKRLITCPARLDTHDSCGFLQVVHYLIGRGYSGGAE